MKYLSTPYLWGTFLLLVSILCLSFRSSLGSAAFASQDAGSGYMFSGDSNSDLHIRDRRLRRDIPLKKIRSGHILSDHSISNSLNAKDNNMNPRKDLPPKAPNTHATRNNSTLFAKDVTIRASSLMETMASLNSTEIASESGEEFLRRILRLVAELMGRNSAALPMAPLKEETATEKPVEARRYTPREVRELRKLRMSLMKVKNLCAWIPLLVGKKIREANKTAYNCRDLADHLEDGSSTVDLENIFIFRCTNQRMQGSLSGLIGCVEAEIGKGKEVATQVDFYLTAFNSLDFIARIMMNMNFDVLDTVSFSYDDPRDYHDLAN